MTWSLSRSRTCNRRWIRSLVENSVYTPKASDGSARRGEITTAHGTFQTPAFMPVGTAGAVKALTAQHLEECGVEIMLANTYHLYLRPGPEVIRNLGGLAVFTGWNKPTLTDSGGYQVFSLQDISRVSDEGVEFQSHLDGSRHMFTPEKVMDIQRDLGADIIMAFDQCVAYPSDEGTAAEAVRRTHQWAGQCQERFGQLSAESDPPRRQHLFGIVQGSTYEHLRSLSAEGIVALDFDGCAIGGLSVGESKQEMEAILAHTIGYLPPDRPRYMMGVGYPEDILMAVSYGVRVHVHRPARLPQRRVHERRPSARSELRLPGVPPLLPGLSPSSVQPVRDYRTYPRYVPLHLLLPAIDGGNSGGDRTGTIRAVSQ